VAGRAPRDPQVSFSRTGVESTRPALVMRFGQQGRESREPAFNVPNLINVPRNPDGCCVIPAGRMINAVWVWDGVSFTGDNPV
jgi:hypothetical protein